MNAYRDPDLAARLAGAIAKLIGHRAFTIHKYKLREMLPSTLRLVSGSRVPVCVTPITYIDQAIALALEHDASRGLSDSRRIRGVRRRPEVRPHHRQPRARGMRVRRNT